MKNIGAAQEGWGWPQPLPTKQNRCPVSAYSLPENHSREESDLEPFRDRERVYVVTKQWSCLNNDMNHYTNEHVLKNSKSSNGLSNIQDYDEAKDDEVVIMDETSNFEKDLRCFQCRHLNMNAVLLGGHRPRDHALSSLIVKSNTTYSSSHPTTGLVEINVDTNLFFVEFYKKKTAIYSHNDTLTSSPEVARAVTGSETLNGNANLSEDTSGICRGYRDENCNVDSEGINHWNPIAFYSDNRGQRFVCVDQEDLLNNSTLSVCPAHSARQIERNHLHYVGIKVTGQRRRRNLRHHKSTSVARKDERLMTVAQLLRLVRYISASLDTGPGTWMGSALLSLMLILTAAACLPSAVNGAKPPPEAFAIGVYVLLH